MCCESFVLNCGHCSDANDGGVKSTIEGCGSQTPAEIAGREFIEARSFCNQKMLPWQFHGKGLSEPLPHLIRTWKASR